MLLKLKKSKKKIIIILYYYNMSFGVKNDSRFDSVKISEVVSTGTITGVSLTTAPLIATGFTIVTAGGIQAVSATQLVNGYVYNGAAGGATTLTLPTAALVQTYLATLGITSAAGLRLPDISVRVSDANPLTVTGAAGTTVVGTVAVNAKTAVCKVVFTGAAAITVLVTVSA